MIRSIQHKVSLALLALLWCVAANAQYSEGDLLKEANTLFDQKAYADAMPLYAQLLSLNPTNPDLNFKYGATALYGETTKKDEAIKYLKFASSKPGVDNKVWYFLARAYHLNYQFADATKAYQKYQSLDSKGASELQVEQELAACANGLQLLSQIKDLRVLDKKQSATEAFFRIYDLSEIGGKILVTPEALLTSLDKKNNHQSLIHFRGPGSDVYFSSYGKDGKDGLDIYRAQMLPDGSFSSPQKLPAAINSPYDENYPFLHPDNQTFYFSSKGHNSMGGYDVFQSQVNPGSGSFSKPENLDFAVNTPDDELFYIADSTKNLANFASARSSRQGQVHVYTVKVQSIPLELTLVKGLFVNKVNPSIKLAKITVIDAASNKEVDSQYTDPNTGDYVLSFPRSGRYKILVEVDKGKTVHSGAVAVPKSQGLTAYLQEMELVLSAGLEKLVINNLFDQTYQGDVMTLAQKILRQRSQLDVNYDPTKEAEAPAVQESDIDLAYHSAGFSIGLSNEQVLAQAEQRVVKIGQEEARAKAYQKQATQAAAEQWQVAKVLGETAIANEAEAKRADELSQPELMFKTALAKMNAETALRKAENADALAQQLGAIAAEQAQFKTEARRAQMELQAALNERNYENALTSLKAEKALQVTEADQSTAAKPMDAVQAQASQSRNQSDAAMAKAGNARQEAATMERELINKKRLREAAKGKEAKQLDEEIGRLKTDISNLVAGVDKRYAAAEKLLIDSRDMQDRLELYKSIENGSFQTENITGTPISASDLASQKSVLNNIIIDDKAVAQYLTDRPDALATVGSTAQMAAFTKVYGGEVETAASLADNTGQAIEKIDVSADTRNNLQPKPKGLKAPNDIAESEALQTPKKPETVSQVPAQMPAVNTIENSNVSKKDAVPAATIPTGSATSSTPSEEVASAVVSPSKSSGAESAGAASAANTAVSEESSQNALRPTIPTGATSINEAKITQNRIEAEKVKINAANDWIAIIDQSIAELERGVGGSDDLDPDDLKAQLEQYTKLKADKIVEKEASEALVAELKMSRTSNKEFEAYARAIADVNSLDASTYAQLESKVVEASTKPVYVRAISEVNRNYIPQLVGIELSGLSAPELAEGRIALNKALIADLDVLIAGDAVSDVDPNQLLELRRIKTIEILQDEQVLSGTRAYTVRTPEAQEYTELISDAPPVEQTASKVPSKLSPAMQQSIASPYSPDDLAPGYSAKLSFIESLEDDVERSAKRIQLNENYLTSVQSEIQLYAVAIEGNKQVDPDVLKRYNKLLQERSSIIDKIKEDKNSLHDQQFTANQSVDYRDTDEVLAASEIAKIKAEKALENDLTALSKIELSPSDQERATSSIYQKSAKNLDAEVVVLVTQLDKEKTENLREHLQVQIQKIDDLAKAHRAEADKWFADFQQSFVGISDVELASIESTSNPSSKPTPNPTVTRTYEKSIVPEVQEIKSKPPTTPMQGEKFEAVVDAPRTEAGSAEVPSASAAPKLQSEAISKPIARVDPSASDNAFDVLIPQSSVNALVITGVNYKSLNANLSNDALTLSLDSMEQMRIQLEALKSEYAVELNPTDKALIATEAQRLRSQAVAIDRRLIATLAKSNAAEVSYYQSANSHLLAQIIDHGKTDAARVNALSFENTSIANALSGIERKAQSGELTKVGRVEDELKIINRLEALNKQLTLGLGDEKGPKTQLASMERLEIEGRSNTVVKGRTYLTEIQSTTLAGISEAARASAIGQSSELNVDTVFVSNANSASQESLLISATPIDSKGFGLLKAQPDHYRYIMASVLADSLRTLERVQAENASKWSAQVAERDVEAARLLNMAEHESVANNKALIIKRVEGLKAESQRDMVRSAIAAQQAEALRASRLQQESIVAIKAKKLSPSELAELNRLVDGPVYSIIPSNLASSEPMKAAPAKPKVKPSVAETTTETTPSMPVANVKPSTVEPKGGISSEKRSGLSEDEERLLSETGNWLALIEIIAEKEDFTDVTERLFIETDGSVYSANKPIPLEVTMPKGLIFQVQIGAFRNSIPQDLFTDIAPVMGQKLPNGITRYRAGIFKAYQDAVSAKELVRSKGYTDAFVVAYIDGEQLTGNQAQAILNEASQVLRKEKAISENANQTALAKGSTTIKGTGKTGATAVLPNPAPLAVDYYNDPEAASASQVESSTGLFYTVQVGVYSKPVKLDNLFNLTELNSELTASKLIRYTSGRYSSPGAAAYRKSEVVSKGVSDAFITAYYNGRRISLDEAAKLQSEGLEITFTDSQTELNNGQNVGTSVEKILYVVILGRFTGDIPQEVANAFLDQSDLQVKRDTDAEGRTMYYSQSFESKTTAEQYLQIMQHAGIADAGIGTIVDGRIQAAP